MSQHTGSGTSPRHSLRPGVKVEWSDLPEVLQEDYVTTLLKRARNLKAWYEAGTIDEYLPGQLETFLGFEHFECCDLKFLSGGGKRLVDNVVWAAEHLPVEHANMVLKSLLHWLGYLNEYGGRNEFGTKDILVVMRADHYDKHGFNLTWCRRRDGDKARKLQDEGFVPIRRSGPNGSHLYFSDWIVGAMVYRGPKGGDTGCVLVGSMQPGDCWSIHT